MIASTYSGIIFPSALAASIAVSIGSQDPMAYAAFRISVMRWQGKSNHMPARHPAMFCIYSTPA